MISEWRTGGNGSGVFGRSRAAVARAGVLRVDPSEGKRQCGEPAEGRQVVNAFVRTNRIESIGVAAGARPINALV